MLFDKVAGFVERNIPGTVADLEQTALFEFPFRAHEKVTPGQFCQEDLDRFFLPFPRIAIEDKASSIFLFDGFPNQIGLWLWPLRFRYIVKFIFSEVSVLALNLLSLLSRSLLLDLETSPEGKILKIGAVF